ncbi:hypothetical protein SAMN05192573_103508 [Mucilaginibacter gossypii]|uniref:Uncharacterized protein n=1 Tax=Mucilaginibacter gossypii TaxID=551996 RepID=A0A1G7UJ62_9SPHI|nr:hypothetical protein SAMN05192573_103508 [Mucilaginibacter gossypii]
MIIRDWHFECSISDLFYFYYSNPFKNLGVSLSDSPLNKSKSEFPNQSNPKSNIPIPKSKINISLQSLYKTDRS